ncbi:MAG: hypothetical protein NTY15_17035 [Planctomycetota bacterium]|nr:hypothetical protein [Planctomycetota bacterium]
MKDAFALKQLQFAFQVLHDDEQQPDQIQIPTIENRYGILTCSNS